MCEQKTCLSGQIDQIKTEMIFSLINLRKLQILVNVKHIDLFLNFKVVEDYLTEAPDEADAGQWVCPVNFAVAEDESVTARLLAEVTRLAPWSAETRAKRGRTIFGVTGAAPHTIEAVARALGTLAEHGNLSEAPVEGIDWQFDMPILVRHLADDLRTFYHEAIAAQPGPDAPNHDALNDWIFDGTALGDALQQIAKHLTEEGSPVSLLVRGLLIPEGHYEGGSAFG